MKLKKLEINGFRCLVDFSIEFDDELTVIVGENDSGKTSLIDCLNIITETGKVENNDFHYGMNEISIKIWVQYAIYEIKYKRQDDSVEIDSFISIPNDEFIGAVKEIIDIEGFNDIDFLKLLADYLGIKYRSNSNIENLKNRIINICDNQIHDPQGFEVPKFPNFSKVHLSSTQFEDISAFFNLLFLKKKQLSIWKEKIVDDKEEASTIEEIVIQRMDDFSSQIKNNIIQRGFVSKIKQFISNFSDIKIETLFEPSKLDFRSQVIFLEGESEINLSKKGDGTKRRITMALLEIKKEDKAQEGSETIYLFDEPDTHLHVKSQLEMLGIIEGFANNGHQVICTTHSPFIINAVHPSKVRLLENNDGISKVKHLTTEVDNSNKVLKSIGIENTYLFFARKIIIVEGESEDRFITAYHQRKTSKPISSALVKIVNVKGIGNIHGFASAILKLHNPNNIFLLCDNDAKGKTRRLIQELNIPADRKFLMGQKEFEDAFDDATLHSCWCRYLDSCGHNYPEKWTVEEIARKRQNCKSSNGKFSDAIVLLTNGHEEPMGKPILAEALGKYIEEDKIPEKLSSLIGLALDMPIATSSN
jgi:putative ATP-dependent endonuclease of OLD family